jgi:hypothetical protein
VVKTSSALLFFIAAHSVLAYQFDVSHVAIDMARSDLRFELSSADLQLFLPGFWLFYSGQNPVPSNQRLDAWLDSNRCAEILRTQRDWLKTARPAFLYSSYYAINSASAWSAPQVSSDRDAREDNLLRNGDFVHGTDDWTIAPNAPGVAVNRDPIRHDRWVLLIPTRDGLFSLSQQLAIPPNVPTLSGHFQVSAPRASKDAPVQIRVRFYNAKGNSLIVAGRTLTSGQTWHTVVIPRSNVPSEMRDRFQIQGNRGQGNVFIAPVFLTAQIDEAARARYVAKLAEVHDELLSSGANPGDQELGQIESEIRRYPAPAEMDSGALSKLLVGTWSVAADVYEYRADGTWRIVSAAQSPPEGEWHINGNQLVQTRGDHAAGADTRQSTIILLNDKDVILGDADRVFHATRVAPGDVDKLAHLAIPDLRSEQTEKPNWPEFVKPEQLHTLQSARDYIVDVHKQLAAGKSRRGEFTSVLQLLKAPSLPIREKDVVGEWRCRSIDVATVGVFSNAFHRCRFALQDGALSFERLGGYAVVRRKGDLHRNEESSFVFIGTRTAYNAEGHAGTSRDSVGILLRKSRNLYVMIFDPTPRFYEIYEIRK